MNCFLPGRIVIGPGPEWSPDSEGIMREELGIDFTVHHDILDIFRANEIPLPETEEWMKHRLPFVAGVPEGLEQEIATHLRSERFSRGRIDVATPDYLVRPSASLQIDNQAVSNAIASANAAAVRSACGTECTVGIVDTGIDYSYFSGSRAIILRQLNAKDPLNPITHFDDPIGHGTLIAHIINQIAPSASLIPVKAIDTDGALSDVLASLYLAHASGPCDIINLSLSMSCDSEACDVCSAPQDSAINIRQLKYFFENFMSLANETILIAAAGNNTNKISTPAAFDGILAVGSYHFQNLSPISNYKAVPAGRYVLGPDGTKNSGEFFATRPGLRGSEPMHGTSFATAFVSGVAARIVCSLKGGPCPHAMNVARGTTNKDVVLNAIRATADSTWSGYDPTHHGIGRLNLI